MFGTVIIDAYAKEEALEIAEAIDDLCCPNDNYGWASAGIYCFWDYYSEAVLYIGLASDLCERFKQHNGLIPMDENCCKKAQIEKYFSCNERLGYSVFVQSPLAQPLVYRNKRTYKKFARQQNAPIEDMLSEQGKDDIKMVEGILIESFRKEHGDIPPWNKIGGSVSGQQRVMKNNINIVRSFCTPSMYEVNPIVSRSTLRELSNNPEYAAYENYLHAIRMNMLMLGMEYKDAVKLVNENDSFGYAERLIEAKYDKKKLVI